MHRCGRRVEVVAVPALGRQHELVPYLRRKRSSRDRDAVHASHLAKGVGVADPGCGGEMGSEAHEPCVVEVVRGAGLAGSGTADVRPRARAALHIHLQDLRHLVGDLLG